VRVTDGDDERSAPGYWWADALNPVENLRALKDVRQFGRRTAEDLADRVFAAGASGRTSDGSDGRPETDLDALMRRLRADSVRAADLWSDLFDGAASMVGALAARAPGAPSAASNPRGLELGPVAPGDRTSAVFWVHNSSALGIAEVRPHCAPLRSHLGTELPADAVAFDPPSLDPLPPRSSCGIEVAVTLPPSTVPGTYVTVVLVSNVPDLYLPLTVDVRPEVPVP
jgi:hypothetical protein